MRLFYDSTISKEDTDFTLNEEESGHACKVLRLKGGDKIAIVNGKGDYFTTEITEPHARKCQVKILSCTSEEPSEKNIHIAIAPTKNMDRIEWFVEKATELGITEITLLLCKNNERKVIKTDRLEKILVAAMKQSKRLYLPVLNELTPVNNFVQSHPNGLIAHCYEDEKGTISNLFKSNNCAILIGPEGDFTLEEVEFANKNGYRAIDLGKNRLRTETAGLYACMQALLRD
jgi:16S rRNA (uracil1498-N3)-methyltransferase